MGTAKVENIKVNCGRDFDFDTEKADRVVHAILGDMSGENSDDNAAEFREVLFDLLHDDSADADWLLYLLFGYVCLVDYVNSVPRNGSDGDVARAVLSGQKADEFFHLSTSARSTFSDTKSFENHVYANRGFDNHYYFCYSAFRDMLWFLLISDAAETAEQLFKDEDSKPSEQGAELPGWIRQKGLWAKTDTKST